MMKKINPYLLTIILALCFLIFTIFARVIMNQTWEKVEDNEKETVVAMVHSRSNHVFDQLNSFYAFVETHKNDEITLDEFNTFSSELMKNDYGVVNYSIAIAGIQEYVYPLEGNEDVLGHNLLEDDREEVVTAVTTAINTGEMTYNGPYPMRTNPDKSIMVFRYPVYNDDGTFYAIINTVIETDKLFINGSEKVDKNKIYDIEIQTIEGVTIYGSVANNDNATEFYSGSFDWIIILDYQESYVKQINLIKNFLNLLFLVIIISIIWSAYLFSKRNKKLSIEIDKMIYYDRLTNLPNRRKLETFFENHPDKKFSLAFADIDDFKYLNDTYGHELGDQALKEISQKFLNALGESVYRWGGDEFIFIIEGDDKDVRKYLERIIEAIKKPLKVDDDWFSLTISIGVLNKANDYETLFDSVKLADMAMYAAKKSGKNQYVFYNSDQGYQLSQFVKFDQMSKTIDFDTQSALYFQPQYSFKTDRIIGIEALFRIEFDDGCVLPKGFIGAAEKNGSIKKLDQYVLLKAIEYHQILQDRNFNIPISVNVSGKTIS
ncbi:MAG: diguanylate cyclase, partial [Candidatus Izimaplasma sp.]|nr:diguanylate cyclase [Candidatus Izimaplasma bacterium]